MKRILFSILSFLLVSVLPLQNGIAQSYTRWGLPNGAVSRLGKGSITSNIAYSPDGTKLAVGSGTGVWIYDTRTGIEVELLTVNNSPVFALAFSPDGGTLASGESHSGTIQLWDVDSGMLKSSLVGYRVHSTWNSFLEFATNGKSLVSVIQAVPKLWDVTTGQYKYIEIEYDGWWASPNHVAFSPDGTILVGAINQTSTDPSRNLDDIHFWDSITGEHKSTIFRVGQVTDLAFSPDGKTIATATVTKDKYPIKLWDVATRELRLTLEGHLIRHINSIEFSPDSKTLASGSDNGEISFWDTTTGQRKSHLEAHEHSVISVAYSPYGGTLASVGGDQLIRFWDAATGGLKLIISGHTDGVHSVAFSPDGRTFASGDPGQCRLWDVDNARQKLTISGLPHYHRRTVVFSPDGKMLASPGPSNGGANGLSGIWDAVTGQPKHNFFSAWPKFGVGSPQYFHRIAYSLDGNTLATAVTLGDSSTLQGFSSRVWLWDATTGQFKLDVTEKNEHSIFGRVRGGILACSPNGELLVVGSQIFNLTTGRWQRTLDSGKPDAIAFSPDSTTLAVVTNDTAHSFRGLIQLWDPRRGSRKANLQGHINIHQGVEQKGQIFSVAYSPNGDTLASAGGDGTVRLWDVVTGEERQVLEGHADWVRSVAYSPDGSLLASGSADGTIMLWRFTPNSDAIVKIMPPKVTSPWVGQQFVVTLNISGGVSVVGYQATVGFDPTALRYVSYSNGDYLPSAAAEARVVLDANSVAIAATSTAGVGNGDGTLCTLTFEVVALKESIMSLSKVVLSDNAGMNTPPLIQDARVVEPPQHVEDVNLDGVVDIADLVLVAKQFGRPGLDRADVNGDGAVNIVDLLLVADAFGNTAAAPSVHSQVLQTITAEDVRQWVTAAKSLNINDARMARGIIVLEQLLAVLIGIEAIPKKTVLLPNYPNPFNPETWIPYQLARDADVTLTIYDTKGVLVRQLDLGYQRGGFYTDREKALQWDGRNDSGESVASGVYTYKFRAGDYVALRRMVILK